MRLLSFNHNGHAGYGALANDAGDDTILDLTGRLPHPTLKEALGDLPAIRDALAGAPRIALSAVTLRSPVERPEKILMVGLNFLHHVKETGREIPKYPSLFTRYPDSLVAHGEPLVRPGVSSKFDYEGELTVVIGAPGRHIPRERALEHVAGYTLCNDGSIRDFQRHTIQFTPGKNFWRSGSVGPWIVTADEIPDPAALSIETRLNGVVVQESSIGDLIFPIPDLIAYISSFTPLTTGDLIAIGTPSGVGAFRDPPLWMKPGDTVEVTVPGIGTLRNGIIDEADTAA